QSQIGHAGARSYRRDGPQTRQSNLKFRVSDAKREHDSAKPQFLRWAFVRFQNFPVSVTEFPSCPYARLSMIMGCRLRLLVLTLIAAGVASAICVAVPPDTSSDDDLEQTLLAADHSSYAVGIDFDSHDVPKPARNTFAHLRRHQRTGSDPVMVREMA